MFKFTRKLKKSVSLEDNAAALEPKDDGEGSTRKCDRSPTDSESQSIEGSTGGQHQAKHLNALSEIRSDFRIVEGILVGEIKGVRHNLKKSQEIAQKHHEELVEILNNMLQTLTVCSKINVELLEKLELMEEKYSMARNKKD